MREKEKETKIRKKIIKETIGGEERGRRKGGKGEED